MMDFFSAEGSWPMRKEKSPVKGVKDYLYEALYDFDKMDKSGMWEIGDEIIDGFDTPRRYQLADLVNEIAKRFELVEPKRVRRSKAEFKGEAGDWTKHQRDDFVKVLNHLLEQIKEEPEKLYWLLQYGEYAAWREGHDADLMIENAYEKYEEITAGVSLSDVPIVPLTQSEEELLADPDIVATSPADRVLRAEVLVLDSSIFHRSRGMIELATTWSTVEVVPEHMILMAEDRRARQIVKHRDGRRSWRRVPLVEPISVEEYEICARLEAIA